VTAPAARADIAAVVGAAAEPDEAEQLTMLPPLRTGLNDTRRAEIADAVRRRGRPPGAKNIATRQALDFIRRVFGDPLIERSRWLLLAPDELASVLGCSTAEAFDRQDRIRADLARFFYAPLAAVDDKGNAVVPSFHMSIGGGAPGAAAADRPPWEGPWLEPPKTQQIRAFQRSRRRVARGRVARRA
jgi:hypothetical protein